MSRHVSHGQGQPFNIFLAPKQGSCSLVYWLAGFVCESLLHQDLNILLVACMRCFFRELAIQPVYAVPDKMDFWIGAQTFIAVCLSTNVLHLDYWRLDTQKSLLLVQTLDLDATIKRRDEARTALLKAASPELLLEGYQTYFPNPVRTHYTAITFSPRLPITQRMANYLMEPKGQILLATGIATTLALSAVAFRSWLARS